MANSKHKPSSQPSMLSTLLFCQPSSLPKKTGRVVRFDEGVPDISYATGSMRERVLSFLKDSQSFATSSEIAKGIASNPSRTTKTLLELVKEGLVESIKLEGCVREYQWRAPTEKSAS